VLALWRGGNGIVGRGGAGNCQARQGARGLDSRGSGWRDAGNYQLADKRRAVCYVGHCCSEAAVISRRYGWSGR
jgi:hypothetical protein